ncbi:hypothetical protein E2C01_046938 [Portunus trituberculatus]|uniref:Uncharacterized protein n=1 Tax=Portunus trituberculatus TaxID=210409 RepID=A0A5B7G947_PORTR|nr:hypothetical protein [Portunus trituberculatus]
MAEGDEGHPHTLFSCPQPTHWALSPARPGPATYPPTTATDGRQLAITRFIPHASPSPVKEPLMGRGKHLVAVSRPASQPMGNTNTGLMVTVIGGPLLWKSLARARRSGTPMAPPPSPLGN